MPEQEKNKKNKRKFDTNTENYLCTVNFSPASVNFSEVRMLIRQELEEREDRMLSPFAARSAKSRGRERAEEECDIRTAYMRDRDRIVHCKAFRRLKDKTQVFLSPQGDHYRTRMMHTLEVSQTARTVAKCLRLNEDLVEAIALGHDLGHTPFGHAGERALNEICPHGFKHNRQSLRIVSRLEKNGQGLNLTWEVRDGILNHGTRDMPSTLEGQVVRFCDKISYFNPLGLTRWHICKQEITKSYSRYRKKYSDKSVINNKVYYSHAPQHI